jgi:hypothetical protein
MGEPAQGSTAGVGSCQAHNAGFSPQKDRCGAAGTVGEVEGSSGCAEIQAPHFSRRQKENCGGCTRTLGAVQSGTGEEGGITVGEPAAKMRQALFLKLLPNGVRAAACGC